MKRIWIFCLGIICLCRCTTHQQGLAEFVNDPKNKITQRITIGNIHTMVKWLPEEYRRLSASGTANTGKINESDSYYYFNARFDRKDDTKLSKEKTLYLDFDMQNDFSLVKGKDSILPAICQRIQNGRSNSYEYMLGFEKKENRDQDFILVYHDKIFGIGTVAFVYNADDIKKIPTLNSQKLNENLN